MNFTLTEEQASIVSAARETEENLLVQALAGAAKTSTLVLVAEALPDTEILCLAFNKRIAVEMQERLPPNCKAMTLNALGHRTWMEATGRRLSIDGGKTYNILSALVENLPSRKQLYDFAELMRVIDFGKQCGYIPTGHHEKAKRLMDDEEFFSHIEQRLDDFNIDVVRQATLKSLDIALKGQCDFNDQILMPTVFHGAFPRYPLILVDEAQDLSSLNHATLRKLAKKRIIAVGDSRQAIYGFRGAHEDSMTMLQQEFSMRELVLSTSFRCPEAIVNHVHWRAPHMKAAENAPIGEVTTLTSWSSEAVPDEAAILCRNNAPLFALAVKLLKQSRHVEVGNADLAKGLLKIMRKFGERRMDVAALLDAISAWEEKEKGKTKPRAHEGIIDRADCMRIFAVQGETLGDAIAYAEHLCASTGPLKLLTGHKAKGLEFNHVLFLDEALVSHEGQDPNLRYVICTRAKQTLTYVDSKNFMEG